MDAPEQDGGQEVMDDTAYSDDQETSESYTLADGLAALADDDEADDEVEATSEESDDEEVADTPDEEEEADPDADLVVTIDGEDIPLSELKEWKKGQLRQDDYTRKLQTVSADRQALLEERAAANNRTVELEESVQAFATFVQGLIPPEPSMSLARSNPGQYTQDKALREQAISELGQLFDVKSKVEQQTQQWSSADVQQFRDSENAELAKVMPALKDPAKLAAFDTRITSAAQEFGFSESEISQTADHRIRQLVHYASLGKKAEANRKNAARRVETPKQGKGRPAQMTASNIDNRKAMQRLSKTGSLRDALQIDFD